MLVVCYHVDGVVWCVEMLVWCFVFGVLSMVCCDVGVLVCCGVVRCGVL